ncbi:hypothetical protein MXB_3272 [Myxobolus squamalis]|nr:hypothetical protein MXB_3272 [Myxobolus squamalis]
MSTLLKREKSSYSNFKIILLFLLTITVVSASIILSVSLTVCCLINQNETLSLLGKNAHKYKHGAVASDQMNCSEIGSQILKENGTAVDAAIATVFCLGVLNMHSSGIGGGGVMIVHNPNSNSHISKRSENFESVVYDYREVVPKQLESVLNVSDPKLLAMGGLSIAVPGEIAGLYMAWKDHGKLPWKRLVDPAIKFAREGFTMHTRLWEATNFMKSFILSDEGLESLLFINGTVRPKYSYLKNPELADTLEKISLDPMSFYDGSLAEDIVNDIKNVSGLITLEDLKNYKVKKRNTIDLKLGNGLVIKAAPPPFGGIIVEFILNILQGYNFTKLNFNSDESTALTYHRIIEAMKFGFAKRTLLGDPDFMDQQYLNQLLHNLTDKNYGESIRSRIAEITQNESYYDPSYISLNDHGTTHISVYASDGSAVSITNSINIWFGSGYRSLKTGITYNNHIDDFSIENRTNAYLLKPSPINNIQPFKRPFSSMSPMFIMNNDKLFMILGGSGGTRIITSVASESQYYIQGFTICLEDDFIYAKSDPRKYGLEDGY